MSCSSYKELLAENDSRIAAINAPFDPVTGENSTGGRRKVHISDFPTPDMFLPVEMFGEELLRRLLKAKTVKNYMRLNSIPYNQENMDLVVEAFIRVRVKYDFPFWCALLAVIKPKGGGDDVPFRLNRPQRKLVEEGFKNLSVLSSPLRLIILKARQWGGSTCTEMFFAWLQLVHGIGLNSLICAQVKDAANEVLDMFTRLVNSYPVCMLHPLGDSYSMNEPKWAGVGNSSNIHRVPQRNCKVKIGSAEKPDSCRGGDYNLVHCTEVGVWRKTEGKEPEDIIDAATGGILLAPLTAIVYESTAKGTGNFFHREWEAAKEGASQFRTIFVAWHEIDQYSLPFPTYEEKRQFALALYENRLDENVMSDREEPGKYLWWLWEKGATLEGIHWYVEERSKYHDHGHMASEYPSDDIEAFVHSGTGVFDKYQVERFKADCRAPMVVGDVVGKAVRGGGALKDVRFISGDNGLLWIWAYPETFPDERVMNRYLVTVDIGGRWRKADWSVISVLDRYEMMEGGLPVIVAQWRGHIDHDLLAWKAAQVAAYYDNALLVIESNTIDREKDTDNGDLSGFILNQIKEAYGNLYARSSSDQQAVVDGAETRYGFHTNSKTKPEIISLLVEVVREHLYIERDKRCLDEYLIYELSDGKYQAAPGPGHHDDLLMTRAIGLWVCYREMERPYFVKKSELRFTAAAAI